jgi:glycosyltransferase involved in cell wall biosynthesis
MKINVIYDYQVFSQQRYGGISRYYYEVAQRVANAPEFTASVVAPLYINEYLKYGRVHVKGVAIPTLPKTGRLIRTLNRIITPFVMRGLHPDLVHETYYSFQTAAPRGCPKVVTVYDMIHEKFPDLFPSNDKTSKAKRTTVNRADCVICISERTRQDLVEIFGINPEKTTVIHLGYSIMGNGNLLACPVNNSPYLLYVGDRFGYKNFDRLLQAYASSNLLRRDFALVAFGGGAFNDNEIHRQRELGLDDGAVKQLSGLDGLLAALYQHAAALVYPSLYEGFGLPPLEAMSYDCPVICSNTSPMPEIVGQAARFFNPYSIDDIRAVIESVMTSGQISHDLILKGREQLKQFSWEKCAAETMAIYQELA